MQRHAMLMYTSCGWFFDELSGLETVQVIHYAGRAVDLAREFLGQEVEAQFLERSAQAKSNLPEYGDGARIYEKWVKPAAVDIRKTGGPLCDQLAVRRLQRERPESIVTSGSRTIFAGGRGQTSSRHRARAVQLADHSEIRDVELWRLSSGRP